MFNEAFRSLAFPIPSDLPNEDTWLGLWARYCRQVAVLHVPFAACEYRIHPGNTMLIADRFERFSRQIHERHRAFSRFLDRRLECVSEKGGRELMALIRAERSRVQGQVVRTVTCPGLPWRDRLKFASLSNSRLLQLRTRVLRWLSSPAHIPAVSLAVRLPYNRF